MTAKKTVPAKAAAPDTRKKPPAAASKPVATRAAVKAPVKASARPASKAGAKTSATKGKLPVLDEDFSDVESDISGEPEAENDADAKAKVKPLRMKVSRAKERALMREFGLDETAGRKFLFTHSYPASTSD